MIQLWMRLWFKWDLSIWVMIYDHLWSFYEILHIWPLLPIMRIWSWVWGVMFNFTQLSWGWISPLFWGLFESWNELFLMSWVWWVLWVMRYIDELFWLLKFFLLYVLWDIRVILWDSDLAPSTSLDGVPMFLT